MPKPNLRAVNKAVPLASDSEVLGVMRDGGLRVCDHAQYNMSEAERQENIQRWKYIRTRIRELSKTYADLPEQPATQSKRLRKA